MTTDTPAPAPVPADAIPEQKSPQESGIPW